MCLNGCSLVFFEYSFQPLVEEYLIRAVHSNPSIYLLSESSQISQRKGEKSLDTQDPPQALLVIVVSAADVHAFEPEEAAGDASDLRLIQSALQFQLDDET